MNLTNHLSRLIFPTKHQERFGKTESGNLSLETARCLDPQGSMCGRAISRTKNLHGTFRRLMKVGGFFVLLVPHLTHDTHYEHPKKR